VDQTGENQQVLPFLMHLNQIGQTGATPRHRKGLSTCCYGEEPHVVGWRFISERRAITLDPNCGWARGKADVVYVADAFQVVAELNRLLNPGKGWIFKIMSESPCNAEGEARTKQIARIF